MLCLAAFGAAGCGDDDDGDSGSSGGGGGGGSSARAEEPAGPAAGACEEVSAPKPKPDGGAKKPSGTLDPGTTYEAVLDTSCGEITIRLAQDTGPKTAASFASLVRSGFYDDTVFHRIVPGFVIQGGDPTGTGTGGPGYSVRDPLPAGTTYTEGVVAMAKTATEPAGTSGSQFYIVTAADAGLPPDYALLGKVTRGIEVAKEIEKLGDPAAGEAGTPIRPVVLEKATLRES